MTLKLKTSVMVGIGIALLTGLSSAARAGGVVGVTKCLPGTVNCSSSSSSVPSIVCSPAYCGRLLIRIISDPGYPSLDQLRAQGFAVFSKPWTDAGVAYTLYFSTNDADLARTLRSGFTLADYRSSGRTTDVTLSFP